MNLKKTLFGLIAASSFGAAMLPAQAAEIIVNLAPPAPRYEYTPSPRAGYVWESGYWRWNGRRHVWVAGHWERAHPGYTYVAPRWVENNGRWEYHSRRWDRDGDGIPNSRDRDKDGDGVANRYDSRPNNPNRN